MDAKNELTGVGIDVIEDDVQSLDDSVFRLLLKDKSTKKNIIWATNDYLSYGEQYGADSEILPELITGEHRFLIQPRSAKAKETQAGRTRDKAEVFTPSWVCNKQNNLIDERWFGNRDIFNVETENGWNTIPTAIDFSGKSWKKYVDAQRLEITCGEAPYLVSRYDTVDGTPIPLLERIGLLDRKLRVVCENAIEDAEWLTWAIRAVQSVFGYEYQGDNILLARENVLLTFIDYYRYRFSCSPDIKTLRVVANIIAWNIWQMDGMKYVAPGSCQDTVFSEYTFFGEQKTIEPCPGCKKNDIYHHNGCYCMIQDWRTKAPVRFIDMMKGRK